MEPYFKNATISYLYLIDVAVQYSIDGITNNLNLGLAYKPRFWGSFEKLRLGFELLMFYYV